MPHRTFDSKEELARYLHLRRSDLDRLIHHEEIPFQKRGDRLVFRKRDVDEWASQRILGLEASRLSEYHQDSSLATRELLQRDRIISDLVGRKLIAPAMPAKTKASVLREMAKLAGATGLVSDEAALLESLREREELCSTGLPGGLALLHPRHPDPYLFDQPLVALGRTVQQIPFGSVDGRATDLFFLIGCPDDKLHLHALARVCMMVQKTDLLTRLREAPDALEMCRVIEESEETVIPKG
jgi:excisionase family DNA binding protein